MLGVYKVKEDKKRVIEGVVHVDGTSRVQLVSSKTNQKFHQLIKEFHHCSNIPMITNTSFNKAGEPIVESPADAVNSFIDMGLDALICGDFIITKK